MPVAAPRSGPCGRGPGVPTGGPAVPTLNPPRLTICQDCVACMARPRLWKLPLSAGHRQTQPRLSLQESSLCLIETKQATNERGCLRLSANQAAHSRERGMKCHRTVTSDPATPLHSQVCTRKLEAHVHTNSVHACPCGQDSRQPKGGNAPSVQPLKDGHTASGPSTQGNVTRSENGVQG